MRRDYKDLPSPQKEIRDPVKSNYLLPVLTVLLVSGVVIAGFIVIRQVLVTFGLHSLLPRKKAQRVKG
jgi:hypothetical protein